MSWAIYQRGGFAFATPWSYLTPSMSRLVKPVNSLLFFAGCGDGEGVDEDIASLSMDGVPSGVSDALLEQLREAAHRHTVPTTGSSSVPQPTPAGAASSSMQIKAMDPSSRCRHNKVRKMHSSLQVPSHTNVTKMVASGVRCVGQVKYMSIEIGPACA